MSYNLTLECGCLVYVSCHPESGIAHTRVIEQRGMGCRNRRHECGVRLWLWEILPERSGDVEAGLLPSDLERGLPRPERSRSQPR
jgi:hypothetical protein